MYVGLVRFIDGCRENRSTACVIPRSPSVILSVLRGFCWTGRRGKGQHKARLRRTGVPHMAASFLPRKLLQRDSRLGRGAESPSRVLPSYFAVHFCQLVMTSIFWRWTSYLYDRACVGQEPVRGTIQITRPRTTVSGHFSDEKTTMSGQELSKADKHRVVS